MLGMVTKHMLATKNNEKRINVLFMNYPPSCFLALQDSANPSQQHLQFPVFQDA
jgi:hypothetical protein